MYMFYMIILSIAQEQYSTINNFFFWIRKSCFFLTYFSYFSFLWHAFRIIHFFSKYFSQSITAILYVLLKCTYSVFSSQNTKKQNKTKVFLWKYILSCIICEFFKLPIWIEYFGTLSENWNCIMQFPIKY